MYLKKTFFILLIGAICVTTLSSFSYASYRPSYLVAQPVQPSYSSSVAPVATQPNYSAMVAPQPRPAPVVQQQTSYSDLVGAPQPRPAPVVVSQPNYSNLVGAPQPQPASVVVSQPSYSNLIGAPQPQPVVVIPPQPNYNTVVVVPQPQPVLVAPETKQKAKLAKYVKKDRYIWFYDEHPKYTYFLSNFYSSPIQMWGMTFQCAEAAYQAAKFAHKPQLMAQFTRLDGKRAKVLAVKFSAAQRPDWSKVREATMLEVLRNKFQQNPELKDLLLCTGDAYLVEHTKKNSFWADGGNGKGDNRLGGLLMQVRGEIGGNGVVNKPQQYRKFVR